MAHVLFGLSSAFIQVDRAGYLSPTVNRQRLLLVAVEKLLLVFGWKLLKRPKAVIGNALNACVP